MLYGQTYFLRNNKAKTSECPKTIQTILIRAQILKFQK